MTNGASQGLFVIVAVVIFGIFVLISYVLFRDTLKPNLANIFTDSLVQVEKVLNGGETGDVGGSGDVEAPEEMENLESVEIAEGVSYVLLRPKYTDTKGVVHSDIFVTFDENENGVTITSVSTTEDGVYGKDNDYASPLGLTGEISFSKTIDGKNITEIESRVFQHSQFTGDFNAPKVTDLQEQSFYKSKFNGIFNAPKVETIGNSVFNSSIFTGDFNAPLLKGTLGSFAFEHSQFTGDFYAPNVEIIGTLVFNKSPFKGDFYAPELHTIYNQAFQTSKFEKIEKHKLDKVGTPNSDIARRTNAKQLNLPYL